MLIFDWQNKVAFKKKHNFQNSKQKNDFYLHKKENIKNKKMAPRGTNRVPLVPHKTP
jgi:hypothetical protein